METARLRRAGGLFMPKEKDGTTKGYAFIEYLDENMAMAAMQQTQGYRLDKNHVFKVNRFDDFERLAKVRVAEALRCRYDCEVCMVRAESRYLQPRADWDCGLLDPLLARPSQVSPEYTPLVQKEYKPRENLQTFMMDDRGRDQFVIRYADETEIYWNDGAHKRAEEVYK
jgi:translation initiation factor 3 subunit B